MKKKQNLVLKISGLLFSMLLMGCSLQTKKESLNTTENEAIENYVTHIQKRHDIPGISLAILKGDSILYRKNFGRANIEHNVPIKNESIFRVYSLTKPIIAVAIFQLIEKGKLSLEDKVGKYIEGIPESWKSIELEYLLTHSSGLPDMSSFPEIEKLTEGEVKEAVFKREIEFDKGEKYAYNQSNFWLLQQIIEKVSGEKLEDFILKNQFENERENVFFSSNSKDIVFNRVTPYFPFRTGKIQIDHSSLKGRYMLAANGLNITIDEFIKWNNRLKKNQLLKKETKEEMWKEFSYKKSTKKFAYSWDKRVLNNHKSYGFSGSLVTAYRVFPDDNLSILFFANGLGNYFNIDNIINHIVSLLEEDIVDINNLIYEEWMQSILTDEEVDIKKKLEITEKNYPAINLEGIINSVGYQLINQNKLEKAIYVFKLNTKEYSNSANTFDSLAEAYFVNKENNKAKKNYEKAIALGGTRGNAKKMLQKINEIKRSNL
ncbi:MULTISPECIES: serine hydrolase domain-containing protein [unclassified Tenacibaculum]|uniref:serine hydrolase domain-containing protein n=1 Tax=unclassified Tenacibaculum TaxID=2635139 RepID=UPI001F314DD0|nr:MULTISPECIES: serine hydrolase domain-containing protein [unclassified Tenacibaculum]MCF2876514.1 beta-lactamase family protein [Tenacibaculum sp. Cn5-1]MCF2936579.1 beta-lactamase family protein [Tenacibaculum sp. Cn5-34]MCG7511828.1 beta-lactamase family protein [Tenacibaculum sp. Cn5-46]